MRLKGKTFVVTGATSGIGRAIAVRLASEGAHVVLLGRDETRLDDLLAELKPLEIKASGHTFDITDDAQITAFTTNITAVDGLIHSAGVVQLASVADADIADLDWQYRVNVRAPYLLTQLLLEGLKRNKGQVVFINSGAGLTAKANWSQYAASKHALKAVADSLRAEVAPEGVRVMTVYPGRTDSSMQRRVKALENEPYDPSVFIRPEDIAEQVVSALCLSRASDVTNLMISPGQP